VEECAQKVKIKTPFLKAKDWPCSNLFVFSQLFLAGRRAVQNNKIYYLGSLFSHFFSPKPIFAIYLKLQENAFSKVEQNIHGTLQILNISVS
jgi:hypothetical protein